MTSLLNAMLIERIPLLTFCASTLRPPVKSVGLKINFTGQGNFGTQTTKPSEVIRIKVLGDLLPLKIRISIVPSQFLLKQV